MNDSLKSWRAEIQGDQTDLEHLARIFTAPPQRFRSDDRSSGFIYESESFLHCSSPDEVQAIANQELQVFSGLLKVDRNSRLPICAVSVFHQNDAGGRVIYASILETVEARAEVGIVGVNVTDEDGNDVTAQPPEPRIVALSRLAAADAAVAKVLRLIALPDADSWVGLYRMHDVVTADLGGEQSLKIRGWGRHDELKRFKHSANSVSVAGDDARHGAESTQSPTAPMSPNEAKDYVHCVIHAWLASKLASSV